MTMKSQVFCRARSWCCSDNSKDDGAMLSENDFDLTATAVEGRRRHVVKGESRKAWHGL